jgi:tetratricopeptide (TPR) repeat protein
MTLDKLKVVARQHEQREEWREAIELYRQAARDGEGAGEGGDPSLYNRIGDLEYRLGNTRAACEAWDQAAARYGEHGLTNNAIALCHKILRLEPSRIHTYLDMATFQARKRMLIEVKSNLTAYRDRMHTVGQADDCRAELERFGATFAGWRELRREVDALLGRDAGEGDDSTAALGGSEGGHGLVFIDTGPIELERASHPVMDAADASSGALMLGDMTLEERPSVDALPGLESTVAGDGGVDATIGSVDGLVDVERTASEVGETAAVEGLDSHVGSVADGPELTVQIDGLETREFTPPTEPVPHAPAVTDDVLFIDLGSSAPATDAQAPAADPSDDAIEMPAITVPDADDPLGQRVAAQAYLERGDRVAGIAALDRALELYSARSEWLHAWQVAGELIDADPQSTARHQARVEVAAKMHDNARLVESYQALGDALVRGGSSDKAVAVYRRLLELDERNEAARAALRAMLPEPTEPAVPEGFVDFGAMVIDDAGPRSTRMRTETTAISDDEDETFREALAEFKRALDQNVAVEDYQAHYDLGIAFKEMGLLDEAVGEFQKALRATEGRLRTAEALGATFLEKGMPPVAEAVLRSVERGPEDDSAKIGVLYWLGRALESQGKGKQARGYYERVLAVDVGFMDTVDRIAGLSAEHSS